MKSIFLVGTVTLAALSPSLLPLGFNQSAQTQPLTAPHAVSVVPLTQGHEGL
ncbi:MAG: hypothetical protein AAFN80_14980 [Pseudomonadota bacterium]